MGVLDEIQMIIEGYNSYDQEDLLISIKGKGDYNKGAVVAIEQTPFKYKDKEGNVQEDGFAKIYGKKKNDGEDTIISIKIPEGSESNALKAINKELKTLNLSAKKVKANKTDDPVHIKK